MTFDRFLQGVLAALPLLSLAVLMILYHHGYLAAIISYFRPKSKEPIEDIIVRARGRERRKK